MEPKKLKTFVELEGTLDQLTQEELGKINGGESSQEPMGIPYIPPPPPIH